MPATMASTAKTGPILTAVILTNDVTPVSTSHTPNKSKPQFLLRFQNMIHSSRHFSRLDHRSPRSLGEHMSGGFDGRTPGWKSVAAAGLQVACLPLFHDFTIVAILLAP